MQTIAVQFQARQQLMFEQPDLPVATTEEVDSMIESDCVVAFGVSGGKDGAAAAIAGIAYLDSVGHKGPRILVHADLGRVEWEDSLPSCQRLADALGAELMVVKRQAGDMMDRWINRWENNVQRYRDLACVKLILPWSTPSMRFCTSELKNQVIERALKKRFPDREILNVTGVRRQESARRRRMPVSKPNKGLTRKGLRGVNWNNVIEWPVEQVFATIERAGIPLHEAYIKYGLTRVSCTFCIMASEADLRASSTCPDNREIYIEMVELEALSTFSFQEGKWLADIAPDLLSPALRERIAVAKVKAIRREQAEAKLPAYLLFEDGLPTSVPSLAEAVLIAQVRGEVADAVGFHIDHLSPEAVIARYEQLFAERSQ